MNAVDPHTQCVTGHRCAQAGCTEDATHVVIETHHLAMLFKSGAGLMCLAHAKASEQIGGAACSVYGVVKTAASDDERHYLQAPAGQL